MKMVLWFALFTCANVSAQNEFLNKSNSIKPLNSGMNTGMSSGMNQSSSLYAPNVFNPGKAANPKSTIPEKKVDLTANEFANHGDIYKDQLNKKMKQDEVGLSMDRAAFRKDSNLGTFMTLSKTITISYRDYGEIDGDFIRIWLNDEVVKELINLDYEYKTITVTLKKGNNTIAFEALNTGMEFPNTAEFLIKDEAGNTITSNGWALDTTFKALITINRN